MVNTRKADGSFKSWNKGLTKETSPSLQVVSQKMSEYRKGKPALNKGHSMQEERKLRHQQKMKGKPAWNKGLTKDTDPRVMSASIKMPGHKCFIDADAMYEMIQKMMHTKSVNKTHNTSKPEDNLYKELVEMYGEEDVIRQYTCEKYPFHCDFYIKSQDLFIEYNGTWDHGDHPFDATNEQDINQLLKLTQKAMQKGEKSRYWNAIYVWTQRDPMKLQTLRDNDLNFKIIYKNTVITK